MQVEEAVVVEEVVLEPSSVVTTCTAGLTVAVPISEPDAATKPKVTRMPQPLRTKWEAALQTAHLEMSPLLPDGNPLKLDGEELKMNI